MIFGGIVLGVVAVIFLYGGLSAWPTEKREMAYDPLFAEQWLWKLPLIVRRGLLVSLGVLAAFGAAVLAFHE